MEWWAVQALVLHRKFDNISRGRLGHLRERRLAMDAVGVVTINRCREFREIKDLATAIGASVIIGHFGRRLNPLLVIRNNCP